MVWLSVTVLVQWAGSRSTHLSTQPARKFGIAMGAGELCVIAPLRWAAPRRTTEAPHLDRRPALGDARIAQRSVRQAKDSVKIGLRDS